MKDEMLHNVKRAESQNQIQDMKNNYNMLKKMDAENSLTPFCLLQHNMSFI